MDRAAPKSTVARRAADVRYLEALVSLSVCLERANADHEAALRFLSANTTPFRHLFDLIHLYRAELCAKRKQGGKLNFSIFQK